MQKKSVIRLLVFLLLMGLLITLIVIGATNIPSNSKLGLEFAGGTQARLQVTAKEKGQKINLATVSEVILKRVDSLGVSNPNVEVESSSGRINVTLAGYQTKDVESLTNLLVSSGNLTMNDSDGNELMSSNDFPKNDAAFLTFDAKEDPAIGLNFNDPTKFARVTKEIYEKQNGDRLLYAYLDFDGLVKKVTAELNKDIDDPLAQLSLARVRPLVDNFCYRYGLGGIQVQDSLCKPHLISRAQVQGEITENAVLSGNFSRNEAQKIIDLINSGTINYDIKLIEVSKISPSYGKTAFNQILIASVVALILVGLFLIFYYGIFGIISFITMCLFIVTTLFIFNQVGGEYSPDVLAAMIIGIGMASDTTIVTLERMKREYQRKLNMGASYLSASIKSLPTIIDSNFTTFITAFMLFWFGTRTVKGFSIMLLNSIVWTLVISVFMNRIASYFLVKSHFLYERPYWFGIRYNEVLKFNYKNLPLKRPFFHKFLLIIRKQTLPKEPKHKYSKFRKTIGYRLTKIREKTIIDYAKFFVVLSLTIIIIGMTMFVTYQPNLGLDFTGGTRFDIIANNDKALDVDEVTKEIVKLTNTDVPVTISTIEGVTHLTYRIQSSNSLLVSNIVNALSKLEYTTNFGTITPEIANEIAINALIAIGAAFAGMTVYCFFRFSWTYALAAIVATIHDAIIMIAIITIFRIELRINAISAILAIIGYSINDTIVTFSRIREEVNDIPKAYVLNKKEIKEIAEKGIRTTIKRSLLTSLTTMIAVVCLLVLGPEATNNFSILMLIGLVFGTYSSIFIATHTWIYLQLWKMKMLKKRLKDSYTEFYGPDEQLIIGINT